MSSMERGWLPHRGRAVPPPTHSPPVIAYMGGWGECAREMRGACVVVSAHMSTVGRAMVTPSEEHLRECVQH